MTGRRRFDTFSPMPRRAATTPPAASAERTTLDQIAPDLRPLGVPIGTLKPDPDNLRTHGDRNLASIRASLALHGQRKPVVATTDGVVVAGNGTLLAARSMGWTHLAVVRYDGPPEKLRAFAVQDNRTAELAEWDRAALSAALPELADQGYTLEELGWNDDELRALDVDVGEPAKGGATDGGTGTDPGAGRYQTQFGVIVICRDEKEQEAVYERLKSDGFECRVVVT